MRFDKLLPNFTRYDHVKKREFLCNNNSLNVTKIVEKCSRIGYRITKQYGANIVQLVGIKYENISRLVGNNVLEKRRQNVPVTGPVVAQRMGRGIALLFHDGGTRRG